jgi:hypothetical protein
MGFLDILVQRGLEKQARSWGKGCARVMLFSFLAAKNHYLSAMVQQGINPTAAWMSRKALIDRNRWHQTNETDFVFDETGDIVSITDDMSLLQVIHYVIEIEYGYDLREVPSWRRQELLALAHEAADKWCSR